MRVINFGLKYIFRNCFNLLWVYLGCVLFLVFLKKFKIFWFWCLLVSLIFWDCCFVKCVGWSFWIFFSFLVLFIVLGCCVFIFRLLLVWELSFVVLIWVSFLNCEVYYSKYDVVICWNWLILCFFCVGWVFDIVLIFFFDIIIISCWRCYFMIMYWYS